MQKIIDVTDLQRRFRAVFDDVVHEHTPYVLTRGSRPEAALIPYEEYLQFLQLREANVIQRMDEVRLRLAERNADYGDDEVRADVAAAIEEARAEADRT